MNDSTFETAVAALKAGKPVVFPTDTVYGIGLSVIHATTPQAIYDIKKRDVGKPIAWLVGSVSALDEYGVDVPGSVHELVSEHWPGALTVIVKASEAVPPAFRSAAGTIGLRMPASEIALSLINAVGNPLATSSANVSGGPDPQRFTDLSPELLAQVPCAIPFDGMIEGIASTVLDCTGPEPRILRQGRVTI